MPGAMVPTPPPPATWEVAFIVTVTLVIPAVCIGWWVYTFIRDRRKR